MEAFVTGATGFVGANLVEALNRRGIRPRVLVRQSSSQAALAGLAFEPIWGDVLDSPDQLAAGMSGVDWVFHVAAVSDYWRKAREQIYRVNVEGTRHAVEAATLAGIGRFVLTSSLSAMGLPAPGHLLTEQDEFNLAPDEWPYGHSKVQAEAVVRQAIGAGLDAVIVNPAVVLGPRDVNQVSGSIITEAARGVLRVAPPGGTNYIHVRDVAVGHIAAAERGRTGERYILGNENLMHTAALRVVVRLLDQPEPWMTIPRWVLPPAGLLVRLLRSFLGNRIPLDANQVRLMGVSIFADAGKAVRELGLPQTPFEDTVTDTIAWYRAAGML